MANLHKGEVSLPVGSETYTLKMTTNAMCELEELMSTPDRLVTFQELSQACAVGSMRHMRGFMWAALREHHPKMTVKDVGVLIQEAGGIAGLAKIFTALLESSIADKSDLETLGIEGGANPPEAGQAPAAGTGPRSVSKPVASGSKRRVSGG